MSVIKQIIKELEGFDSKEIATIRKEIALLIALRRSAELSEQKTISSNVAAYLASK